jgi:hypothetical protein
LKRARSPELLAVRIKLVALKRAISTLTRVSAGFQNSRLNIWVLVLFGLLALDKPSARSDLVEVITPTAVTELFNGRDLSGLYSWLVDSGREDTRHVFTVTNGMIRISGDGLGYLATEKAYENYRLVVEYKWGNRNWTWGDRIGKARDSGIFLHSNGPDGNSHDGKGAFMAAIECNVFQGATGDFLLIRGTDDVGQPIAPRITAEIAEDYDADGWPFWHRGGRTRTIQTWGRLNWFGKDRSWRDELDFRGACDVEKQPDEWNRVECVCIGDRITIVLNGVVVNEAAVVSPRRGKILLQCEGSEIFFRRFELHPVEN